MIPDSLLPDGLMMILGDRDMMVPLLGSLFCGGLIGAEREFQGKPAGLRTHTLVCFASALMTLLGLRMDEWAVSLPAGAQIVSDMARMPHVILPGVGFLGAGVIFREGASVQGLTTAASLWLTAAVGIVLGAGLIELAALSTGFALIVLVLLRALQRLMPPRREFRIEVAVAEASPWDGAALTAILSAQDLKVGSLAVQQDSDRAQRCYTLLAFAQTRAIDCDHIFRALSGGEGIGGVAVVPLLNDPTATK